VKQTQILLIGILLLASFLRFYKIDTIPHGLYIDEISISYNAYTILTKGVDEYGVAHPLFFKAFGEYKMPVTIYLTSASMSVFGKNEFAVRFPSAFFGTLTVLLLYCLIQILFKNKRIALLSAFLLAISPWHLQFSRGEFEATIALFFYLLGIFFFLKFRDHKQFRLLIWSGLSFVITFYTYNAYKMITPLTVIVGVVYLASAFAQFRRKLWIFSLGICVLALPVFLFSGGNNRFFETSAFSEYGHVSFLQKCFVYPMIYLRNYLSYFSLPFLFVTNDGFGRHTVVGMGPLFRFELPLFLVGVCALWRQKKEFGVRVIGFLLCIAPMAASLAVPSPHALRSLLMVVPLTIIVSYGVVAFWEKKNKISKVLFISFTLFALYEYGLYLHLYYTHYPLRTALDWGGEYKQVIAEAQKRQKQYPQIVVNSSIGMMPLYSNFYAPSLHYLFVGYNWQKPASWHNKKVLYITGENTKKDHYLQRIPHTHLQDIHFSNLNHDTFARFWEL